MSRTQVRSPSPWAGSSAACPLSVVTLLVAEGRRPGSDQPLQGNLCPQGRLGGGYWGRLPGLSVPKAAELRPGKRQLQQREKGREDSHRVETAAKSPGAEC